MPTLHLIGVGKVGRAVLELLAAGPAGVCLLACTDRSGTVHRPAGVDPAGVSAAKEAGEGVAALPGGAGGDVLAAVESVAADVVLDAMPSEADVVATSEGLGDRVLQRGGRLVVAGKRAAALAANRWFRDPEVVARVGVNAALGGAGARLMADLPQLRRDWRQLELVGNATSSMVLDGLAAGEGMAAAIQRCADAGMLESDPTSDLDGSDGAVKLALVLGVLTGQAHSPDTVERVDLRRLDVERIRQMGARGLVPRLVGMADRGDGESLRQELCAFPPEHPLAVTPRQVGYGYRLSGGGFRVDVGKGVGPIPTAQAALEDVRALAAGVP